MNTDRIDFISNYCDRWCERCAFTHRCSAFAVEAAIAMCGDIREGMELAVGLPRSADSDERERAVPDWMADLQNVELTPEESAEIDRDEKARDDRLEETPIMKIGWSITMLSHQWLKARAKAVGKGADDVLREALEIVHHDAAFVTAKLHRALDGRDRHSSGDDDGDDHPIQNDWNGSAKVALISIERSETAWRVIAEATGEATPLALANQFRDLRTAVDDAFPNARRFVRPGFDEPRR